MPFAATIVNCAAATLGGSRCQWFKAETSNRQQLASEDIKPNELNRQQSPPPPQRRAMACFGMQRQPPPRNMAPIHHFPLWTKTIFPIAPILFKQAAACRGKGFLFGSMPDRLPKRRVIKITRCCFHWDSDKNSPGW